MCGLDTLAPSSRALDHRRNRARPLGRRAPPRSSGMRPPRASSDPLGSRVRDPFGRRVPGEALAETGVSRRGCETVRRRRGRRGSSFCAHWSGSAPDAGPDAPDPQVAGTTDAGPDRAAPPTRCDAPSCDAHGRAELRYRGRSHRLRSTASYGGRRTTSPADRNPETRNHDHALPEPCGASR